MLTHLPAKKEKKSTHTIPKGVSYSTRFQNNDQDADIHHKEHNLSKQIFEIVKRPNTVSNLYGGRNWFTPFYFLFMCVYVS